MTRTSKGELIFGFLTPIMGVIGFSIFMFAPIRTVGTTINDEPMMIQHVSAFSESNGNALSQYLLVYVIVFLLTLSVAASAAVHAASRTRAAAVVLWVSSTLLWIGTYADPEPFQIRYLGVLAVLGPYLVGAMACAFLASAIAIAVDARRRPGLA